MPYIDLDARDRLQAASRVDFFVAGATARSAGELNYMVTQLIRGYLTQTGYRYEHINAVIGVLEAAKLEFYRRRAAPYEDTKIKENGDVY